MVVAWATSPPCYVRSPKPQLRKNASGTKIQVKIQDGDLAKSDALVAWSALIAGVCGNIAVILQRLSSPSTGTRSASAYASDSLVPVEGLSPYIMPAHLVGLLWLAESGAILVSSEELEQLLSFTWHFYAIDPEKDYSQETFTLVEFKW